MLHVYHLEVEGNGQARNRCRQGQGRPLPVPLAIHQGQAYYRWYGVITPCDTNKNNCL